MSPLAKLHLNCAELRNKYVKTGNKAQSFPCKGQKQLISHYPYVVCDIEKYKKTSDCKTRLDQVLFPQKKSLGDLEIGTNYQYNQIKIIVNIPENIAHCCFFDNQIWLVCKYILSVLERWKKLLTAQFFSDTLKISMVMCLIFGLFPP